MKSKEFLNKVKNLSKEEQKNISYDELESIVSEMTADEIIELSKIIGYPVFTRMCMGSLRHKFVLLQDGAAAVLVNKEGQILLQSRADRDKWGLPGGCQVLGETMEETIIREIKEETNLTVAMISMLSLEVAMIYQFGDQDEVFRQTMVACTGFVIVIINSILAISMIVKANKNLK